MCANLRPEISVSIKDFSHSEETPVVLEGTSETISYSPLTSELMPTNVWIRKILPAPQEELETQLKSDLCNPKL